MVAQVSEVSQQLLDSVNGTKKTEKATSLAEQDRFMTLLATQMKNQDPMNPLDNAQMTSQLAQLSTLAGVEKLNTTLQQLMGSYQSSQSLQAAGTIGHNVLVPGDKLKLAEGEALFGITLTEPADKVQVDIKDSNGNVLQSINLGKLDAGVHPLSWDGKTDQGTTAKDGKYTFSVTSSFDGKAQNPTALSLGKVASVVTTGQDVKLNLPDVGTVKLSDVHQIF